MWRVVITVHAHWDNAYAVARCGLAREVVSQYQAECLYVMFVGLR